MAACRPSGCWRSSSSSAERRFDPFGRSLERRTERKLIEDYEAMLEEVLGKLTPGEPSPCRRPRRDPGKDSRLRSCQATPSHGGEGGRGRAVRAIPRRRAGAAQGRGIAGTFRHGLPSRSVHNSFTFEAAGCGPAAGLPPATRGRSRPSFRQAVCRHGEAVNKLPACDGCGERALRLKSSMLQQ